MIRYETFFNILWGTVVVLGLMITLSTPSVAMTMNQLTHVASQCRQDIISAHQQKTHVSKDHARDYAIALGIAAEKCDKITKVFLDVQKASQDYVIYKENLHRAQEYSGMQNSAHDENHTEIEQAPKLTHVTPDTDIDTSYHKDATDFSSDPSNQDETYSDEDSSTNSLQPTPLR